MLKKLFLAFTVICILAAAGGMGVLYWLVVLHPGEEIQAENIYRILSRESNVYYSDGTTKLGVFFDTAHRQYVTYAEIPENFVNSLVASEDNRFFDHLGFDPVGIGRAMVKNIEAGRIVQGGSTLTQQTAKNLFKRTERSYEAKLKELLYALRLEYHYPKEKIFEFYANQFYVSGNGHGLGVAARYYFDKKPSELTLAECAFIAGSVKRPNYYNPFIKKTEEDAELARSRARVRLRYVLDKMRDLEMIDAFSYNDALARDLEFTKGQVGFDLDYGMELVRDAVSSNEVLEVLESHGVTNIATSGVRVVTSIDWELQRKTLAILRSELSRLDVRLRGYEREEVQTELAAMTYTGDSQVQEDAFLFGTIERVESEGGQVRVDVALDKKLGVGVIEAAGLQHLVKARVKYLKNRWSEPKKGDLAKLVAELQPGDRVWVRVLPLKEEAPVGLALEKYPQVQGGALIIKDGAIRGMAGGSENRFFNRAVHARRTMGSAFKPLVYAAALQLGWNTLDPLKNSRNLFVYHGQPYFPRPDHKSPHTWVSMNWAGVKSENLASVWLLSHLCDKLGPQQFREVADHLGFTPRVIDGQEEPYRTYKARIRDRYGIVVNQETLKATAYATAVKNLETDFIFDNMVDQYEKIKKIPYGLHYDKFRIQLEEELAGGRGTLKKHQIKELELRIDLLRKHYLLLEMLRKGLTAYRANLEQIVSSFSGRVDFSRFMDEASLYRDNWSGEYYFLPLESEKSDMSLVNPLELRERLLTADQFEIIDFWQNISLNKTVTVEAFDKVAGQLDHELQKLRKGLPYSFEVLARVEDFRITVGLYYLIEFAKELGISSKLEPVLSFPLGSNVVTLFEATRMYEALVTGMVTTYSDHQSEDGVDSLAILDRIEADDGTILYQRQPFSKKVIDSKSSLAVGNILENVVKFGTGRSGGKKVRIGGSVEDDSEIGDLNLPVPFLGKTGTANRYTNASFFGYLPGVAENGVAMTVGDGYAIGVYVGFDNNLPMRVKSSRISGAAGALPAWSDVANTLLDVKEYRNRLDPVDLSFYGLGIKQNELGQMNVGVDPDQGGKALEPFKKVSDLNRFEPSVMTFGSSTEKGRFVVERNFTPFWKIHPVVQ